MTVLAAEAAAAPAAAAGEGAAAAGASRAAPAARFGARGAPGVPAPPDAPPARVGGGRERGERGQRRPPAGVRREPMPRRRPGEYSATARGERGQRARQQSQRARQQRARRPAGRPGRGGLDVFTMPGFGRYDRIVATEALVCLVLIAATPILGKQSSAGGKGTTPVGLPSVERTLVRLTATLFLFAVLSLVAQGQRAGKAAAIFGGIVTLAVIGNSIGEFQTLAAYFGGTSSAAAAKQAAANRAAAQAQAAGTAPAGAAAAAGGVIAAAAGAQTRGWAGA